MSTHADLIVVGGTIITMDPLRPRVDGVAVRDGRVEVTGTAAEVRRLAGPRTRVVDLAGRAATPGLVDGHAHLVGLGRALEQASLRGAASAEEAAALVAEAARDRPAGEWIQGRGWDQNLWPGKAFPTHAILDGVVPSHPVAMRRIDGHALWVNAAALRAAGVTRDTADPPGGKIVRDERGEPTGVFIDNAMELIERKIPDATPAAVRRHILAGAKAAVAAGLVGVHDMGIDDVAIAEYRALAASGELPLRVYAFLEGSTLADTLAGRRPDEDPDGTALFVLRGVKLYADGALGSRGAALLEPYVDDPGNRGLVLTPAERIREVAKVALAHGWQVGTHAIGDRANREVLDAYEAAGVTAASRFRVEHAQVVAPADFERFARLGVIASMQPTHATSDMPWVEARVGPERAKGAYAWRTMLEAGARLSSGSDFPVEEVPPLHGLWAAVTRQDREGLPGGGWFPEQRLSLDEAVHSYTVGPAFASFSEMHRGRLVPGQVADITIYDRDLRPESLRDTQVDLTIVGGRVVYERR